MLDHISSGSCSGTAGQQLLQAAYHLEQHDSEDHAFGRAVQSRTYDEWQAAILALPQHTELRVYVIDVTVIFKV